MSALSDHIEKLLSKLASSRLHPPSLDVRIIEPHGLKDGKYHVRREELHTISEYETRFDEVLRSGSSWVNVHCEGTYDNYLIVSVTFNSKERCVDTPSVMIGGPARIVLDRGWSSDPLLVVE